MSSRTAVQCPVCQRSVYEFFINKHLDSGCQAHVLGHLTSDTTVAAGTAETIAVTPDMTHPPGTPTSRKRVRGDSDPRSPCVPGRTQSILTGGAQGQLTLGSTAARVNPRPPPSAVTNGPVDEPVGTQLPAAAEVVADKSKSKSRAASRPAAPLAELMRPKTFDEFYGQTELVGPKGVLRQLVTQQRLPSLILWGPPGTGKTTLARIIAQSIGAYFRELSAVSQGLADVKKVLEEAQQAIRYTRGRTIILFIDEIHRFNKAQQDFFLPYVERGALTLIGATTENPSFKVNNALLSRTRVFVLQKIGDETMVEILQRAAQYKRGWEEKPAVMERQVDAVQPEGPAGESLETVIPLDSEDAVGAKAGPGIVTTPSAMDERELAVLNHIVSLSNGDARTAINTLEVALDTQTGSSLSIDDVKRALQKTHLLYDRDGDEHYDIISAFHKSVRGSDDNATLYWLGRMLEAGEDPLYVARRMIRIASEDVGLADNNALPMAVAAYQTCQFIGMPECDVTLAHCATYLARARKNVEVYQAYKRVKQTIAEGNVEPVPLHLRNAPTRLMSDLGYAQGYKYNPDFDGPVDQTYLPDRLKVKEFFTP
ncbi:DNA-dependent ATPase mgs1 [Tieghemiomyces parasiticus]|uniref:DNA-dependent ATPase mgs1 n=1 Tax=Tieghemiomyces parasiticus TaxID=78921 RepID=A0A9W8AF61_9FUNG|nr:DNA-dependent ATPase mgs1 [Tieghemiomyces parasiticus]